jgi:hypothetical protein
MCHLLTALGLWLFQVFVIVWQAVDIAVRVIALAAHAFDVCTHTLEVLARQGKSLRGAKHQFFSRNAAL